MKALKGKGALDSCPKCSGGVRYNEQDYVDNEHEVKRLSCENCGAQFTELWGVVDWEEVTE